MTLPSKLSDLLELAVRDAELCAANPRYVLDMGAWHKPAIDSSVCYVCMAGAVIAQTLGSDPNSEIRPSGLNKAALFAINEMRSGYFALAADRLGDVVTDVHVACGDLVDESFDWNLDRAPWSAYLECVRLLRSEGL